jgi:hypothetical protein
MHNLVNRRNHNPSDLLLWVGLTGILYILGIRKRHPFSCGKAGILGSAYFHHLEGSFPLGESLWSPSWFSTRRRTRSRTPSSLLCTVRWRWRLSALLYHAFQVAACQQRSLMESTSSRRNYSCIGSLEYWTREEPIKVSGEDRLWPRRPGRTGSPRWPD